MNEHTLKVLEYDKIKEIAAGYALSEPGKIAVAGLAPAVDRAIAETRLRETREFLQVLESGEAPPLDGIHDIRRPIEQIGTAGTLLSPADLLAIAHTLGAGRRVKGFFQNYQARGGASKPAVPLLRALTDTISPRKPLEDAVFSAIDEQADVRDSASPALRKLRKQIGRVRDEIYDRMAGLLRSSACQNVIQEQVITVRDDRYVLPLKPNFRQSIQGIVHGQSGSRATLFVEPLDVLDQNNRLAELRMEEREEVERILRELTSRMFQEAAVIEETFGVLAAVDAIHARARFGIEYQGTVPAISDDGHIRLRAARHPLLVRKARTTENGPAAVPNDIDLGGAERLLIVSGPNTGGKTVVLKTIGLLCLMAQSGLPVLAAEGSIVPVFSGIFADIGDEQSLEQNLSTFSSHISQIAPILKSAGRDALVLLDELGAGTDPSEGAALGAAVLEALLERGCVSVVTTHHNAVKLFGSQTRGAVNAAMEFDGRTLQPTYRFLPGLPGRSYGFDMAARLGVPAEVIQKARARLSDDEAGLEGLLEQVEADSQAVALQRVELAKELDAARQDREATEREGRAAVEEARAELARARGEARDVLSQLRKKLQELLSASVPDRAELRAVAKEVESLAKRLADPGPRPEQAQSGVVPDLRVGDRVTVSRLNKTGTVLVSRSGMVEIDVEGKKLKLPAGEVVLAAGASPRGETKTPGGWGTELHEIIGLPDTLNIIGQHVPEALAEVDRYIDRAPLSGISSVSIIHGMGTGALKNAVREFLKTHPLVAAVRSGTPAEGGAGVTVAELKK